MTKGRSGGGGSGGGGGEGEERVVVPGRNSLSPEWSYMDGGGGVRGSRIEKDDALLSGLSGEGGGV